MQHLEVSGAVGHIYVVRQLRVKERDGVTYLFLFVIYVTRLFKTY
jgi:hypothetical protein